MKKLTYITLFAFLWTLSAQADFTLNLTDSYTQDNNVSGSGDGVADGALNQSGYEQYIGAAAGGGQERKAFFNVELPSVDSQTLLALTSGSNIDTATLRVYYGGDNGTPTDNLSLFYDTKGSINTVAADMFSSDYDDTGLGILQGATSGAYVEFDVTSLIQGAYNESNNIASFRFEVDGNILLGQGAAVYKLRGAGADANMIPQLFLATVPEPSTAALLAGCFALASVMIRRRR